jgi:8-oxo-dGTP diphosphatase
LAVLGEGPLAAQTCGVCGTTHYHGARPCAGALVVREHAVLLVRRALEPFKDYWDIPGGFLEAGEHPEEGARREVLEETGLEVKITGLHGIYMDRYGDDDARPTLNIYYLAAPIGGALRPASDASEVKWFAWNQLPERIAFAHAPKVLEDWRAKELESVSI